MPQNAPHLSTLPGNNLNQNLPAGMQVGLDLRIFRISIFGYHYPQCPIPENKKKRAFGAF